MAEVVHRNLEAMLPQLESLESSGIFSHDEIRFIVRRRRNHEYKLVRRPARKEDYLAAIQYEVHLDMLRKLRKKKHGIATTRKDADNGIQNRIHGLFRRALKKFKGDLKMWLQYIEFAKRCRHKITLSKIYGRALAIHPNNPGLWVMAAKFEFEELKDVFAARTLIQQGLRANSDSKHLWREHFRLELIHADLVRKKRAVLSLRDGDVEAPVSDEFLANKTALIVFNEAMRVIPGDVEFHVSFLPIMHLFENTAELQNEIYDSLKSSHASHPLMWDALARRHWYSIDTAVLDDDQIGELEDKSEKIFAEGLSGLAEGREDTLSAKETEMWSVYLTWCEERYGDKNISETLKEKSLRRLLEAYSTSLSNSRLSEAMCKQYIETLESIGQTKEVMSVCSLATDAHPESVGLWLLRLEKLAEAHNQGSQSRNKLKKKKEDTIICDVCRDALKKVPEKESLPLWLFWLEYLLNCEVLTNQLTFNKRVERLFQNGLKCEAAPILETLSNRYLEWSFQSGDITQARAVYRELLEKRPVPFSLYMNIIQVEKSEAVASKGESNMDRIRELFESALRDYGSSQPDLWLEYIQTELWCPGGDPGNVGKLHWRAMKELQDQLTADFVSKYTLLNLH